MTCKPADQLKDARFQIPTPALLAKVVDLIDAIPMADRDTNGDLYEYLLSQIATAGKNGQFRTPRHIIQLMVDIMAPQPRQKICDPACGTAGFLVAAAEYLRQHSPEIWHSPELSRFFNHHTFYGYDFDATMLRLASMNMLLHGIENPDIRYRDSLSTKCADDRGNYDLILANPPFTGSIDYEQMAKDLATLGTKKTELLFLALFIKMLRVGGRAAVIVPDGVLFGSTKAHKTLRRELVEEQRLDAVVKLPSGVFRPYAGVSTAILFFTRTDAGGTENVWFYDVTADGFSLDDKRTPITANDLPDVLARWQTRDDEISRTRTDKSFLVPRSEIEANGYDLSINRYKEIVPDTTEHRDPLEIISELQLLDSEIATGLSHLRSLLLHDDDGSARVQLEVGTEA